MEEKANNKKKELLTIVAVFAVVLAVTATGCCTEDQVNNEAEEQSKSASFKNPAPPQSNMHGANATLLITSRGSCYCTMMPIVMGV